MEPLQDIVIESPTQDNLVVHEEQTQDPQEPMLHEPVPLRRSTRERRSAIPDDYVVFLQEHEENNGMMEDDPVNFGSSSIKPCKILTQKSELKQ